MVATVSVYVDAGGSDGSPGSSTDIDALGAPNLQFRTEDTSTVDNAKPIEMAIDYADNAVIGYGGSVGLLHIQNQILQLWDLNCNHIIADSGKVYCKNNNIIYRLDTISNEIFEWDMPTPSVVYDLTTDNSGNIFFTFFDGYYKIGKISVSDNLVTLWTSPSTPGRLKVNSSGNVFFGGQSLTELITSEDKFLTMPIVCDNISIDTNDAVYCSAGSSTTKIIIKS